jgi:hypothetical protein
MPRTVNATLAALVVGARRACPDEHEVAFRFSLVADPGVRDQSNLGIVFNEIARGTLPTLPASWETLHDRWEWYHSLRTAASLVGLACAFRSVLLVRPQWR